MYFLDHMSIYTKVFLAMLAVKMLIQSYLDQRNQRALNRNKNAVPKLFADQITESDHKKAYLYNTDKIKIGKIFRHINMLILLFWTMGGGLDLIVSWSSKFSENEFSQSVFTIIAFSVISTLLQIPMSIYQTFVIEERHGFNKTTPKIFIIDLFKSGLLSLVISLPLFIGLIYLIENFRDTWWPYAWAGFFGIQFILMWAYPTFIAPMFNKFTPLDNEELKGGITDMFQRAEFSVKDIFVMDASKRSSHGNAYFTGFGKNKRIVFFDTLIDKLSTNEILAVLAHELGHSKLKHIQKSLVVSAIFSLILFYGLHLALNGHYFIVGHGLTIPQTAAIVLQFSLIMPIYLFFLTPLFNYFSRKNEFEADAFAGKYASAKDLISGLLKLYKYNSGNLVTDELYSAFYDSHPPATIRINHLMKMENK